VAAPRSAGRGKAKTAAKASAAIPQLGWSEIRPAPIVLVSGTESFLADRAIRRLRDFLVSEDPSLEVNDVAADSYAPGELLTVASPSLFGEPRLVRVSQVEKCSDQFLTEAIRYLEAPPEGAYLVLRHNGGVRGKKLLDAISMPPPAPERIASSSFLPRLPPPCRSTTVAPSAGWARYSIISTRNASEHFSTLETRSSRGSSNSDGLASVTSSPGW